MTRPNPHIALIYHYDLARALNGEPVDWVAIPVNVDAGREGGDLCRAAADFAKRRDLFAMVKPTVHYDSLENAWVDGVRRPDLDHVGFESNKVAAPAAPNAVGQPVAEPEPPVPAQGEAQGSATKNDSIANLANVYGNPATSNDVRITTHTPADRDRLRARIADLIAADQAADAKDRETLLRAWWPPDVAPLSQPGHTDAELAAILAAVRRVETEVGAGWHPDDGPPPHVNTDPRAVVEYPVAEVDEGGPVAQADIDALAAAFGALTTTDAVELCEQIAAEANAAGRSISVSANPTLRRWSIARAVIAWAASGRTVDDLWFAASMIATHQQCMDPAATLGGLVSQFDIAQADRLYAAAADVEPPF